MRDPEGPKKHCFNLSTLEKGNINFKQKRKQKLNALIKS
jgi:hypothetical protein